MSTQTLAAVALLTICTGCSAAAGQHTSSSCELTTREICLQATGVTLVLNTRTDGYPGWSYDEQLVVFVVAMFRTDGVLAAEVNCHADLDSEGLSLVRPSLGILTSSQQSIDYLRDHHLCAASEDRKSDWIADVQATAPDQLLALTSSAK